MINHEEALFAEGYTLIGGVDEAGRGPLAGPVVACAVVMPHGVLIDGVRDSKKLTPKRRAELAPIIKEKAIAYSVGIVDVETIERINILQATLLAMKQAIESLAVIPGALLIDGLFVPVLSSGIHTVPLKFGDRLSHSVAAASIIAKVWRDALMEDMDLQYPQYGFARHKGYGTPQHIAALQAYGPCPHHRKSFIKRFV